VLHLGQDDLPVPVARRILGPGPIIGRSSHSQGQASAAATEDGIDYFCAGPVWATPTKPGRQGTGLPLVTQTAKLGPGRPWFAIGGIGRPQLDEVLAAGATRVVVVRALTEADDPGAAAADFARRLRAAWRRPSLAPRAQDAADIAGLGVAVPVEDRAQVVQVGLAGVTGQVMLQGLAGGTGRPGVPELVADRRPELGD
jgi:hypothetical protein